MSFNIYPNPFPCLEIPVAGFSGSTPHHTSALFKLSAFERRATVIRSGEVRSFWPLLHWHGLAGTLHAEPHVLNGAPS